MLNNDARVIDLSLLYFFDCLGNDFKSDIIYLKARALRKQMKFNKFSENLSQRRMVDTCILF